MPRRPPLSDSNARRNAVTNSVTRPSDVALAFPRPGPNDPMVVAARLANLAASLERDRVDLGLRSWSDADREELPDEPDHDTRDADDPDDES